MRIILIVLLLTLPGVARLTRIRDRNVAVAQAQVAYRRGDFRRAAGLYRQAVEQYGATDEAVVLNLAHACAKARQPSQARGYYGRLTTASSTPAVRSVAQQQLAVLAAGKGDYAQAVSWLRKALLADPTNAQARHNYEVLRDYLTRHPNEPRIPPPAPQSGLNKANGASQPTPSPQPRPGNDQQGQLNDPNQPDDPRNAPQQRNAPTGQRNPNEPASTAGDQTADNFRPGAGPPQRVAQGTQPGDTRGLNSAAEEGSGQNRAAGRRAGAEAASLNETQLQTQRERLQQMNLSTGQAQQLLDALRTAEQQYIQQMPHRSSQKPNPKKPTW